MDMVDPDSLICFGHVNGRKMGNGEGEKQHAMPFQKNTGQNCLPCPSIIGMCPSMECKMSP